MALLFSGFSTHVAAPHRQGTEVGQPELTNSNRSDIENRKFSDFTNAYIPEISEHLTASRSGWLALWSNSTELGRPLYQISGFSSTYLPTLIFSKIVQDPWRLATALSLSFCFFAGFFILLFAREIRLTPIAGLIAGTSLATSPLFMYWLTFPMFPAVWCWSAGALWAVTRLAKHYDLLSWSVLAFSAYSLLMTAYPQPVVFHAYILGGYGCWLTFHQIRISKMTSVQFLALAVSALLVGAALAFPVYRDLLILLLESARASPDPSFFTVVLPKVGNFSEFVRFFVLGTVPEIFGNPIAPTFPFSYNGLSVTLVVIFFAVAGLLAAFKKTWGWWLPILVLCLLAFVHPLYVFGVKYLGFNLSRSTPLGGIMLPLTVITAFSVDALTKRIRQVDRAKIVFFSGALTIVVIGIGTAYGMSQQAPVRWELITGMLLASGLLIAQYDQPRPLLLVIALASVVAMTSYPLILRQNPGQIAMTSPLVETIRKNLPQGSRYAVATPGVSVLPPNLNATVGLASVHSYNSLSSTRYHTLIKELGGQVQTYGRWNGSISPDYSSPMFWMSNISLILSPVKLTHRNIEALGEVAGTHLYRVNSRMGESLQVVPQRLDTRLARMTINDPRMLGNERPIKVLDEGDALEFEVTPMAPSVFLLSQKFHRDWQAHTYTNNEWRVASAIEI
ncbi:MAG TPA: hypothetical protein DIW43_18190, partial [Spongiibacteraceae bacterium]|nr:hypothetical protein [Spongiibacteraceae bacterium]